MNFLRSAFGGVNIDEDDIDTDDEALPIESDIKKDLPLLIPLSTLDILSKKEKQEDESVSSSSSCGYYDQVPLEFYPKLRIGPNYTKNKLKEQSLIAHCELLGVDIFKSESRLDNIGERLKFPDEWINNNIDEPSIFIINVQIPINVGSVIGSFFSSSSSLTTTTKPNDGIGVSVVYYFKINNDQDKDKDSPSKKLFKAYCKDSTPYKGRFKVVVTCTNLSEFGLPEFITQYSSKPILIKTSGTVYHHKNYVEQDINVHAFGMVARRGLSIMLPKIPQMKFHVGFCIESREDDEMPECILGYANFENCNHENIEQMVETY